MYLKYFDFYFNDFFSNNRDEYCFNCYEWGQVNKTTCLEGWTDDTCSTPICSNCKSTENCVLPNICECQKNIYKQCATTTYCDLNNDCFPGTCQNNQCICISGYESNCQYISLRARIINCVFHVVYDNNNIEIIPCSSQRLNNGKVNIWLNAKKIDSIKGNWDYEFDADPFQHMTDLPNYISNPYIEINESYYEVSFTNENKRKANCLLNFKKSCKDINFDWPISFIPQNEHSIDITVKAVLGGQKTILINGQSIVKKFYQTDLNNKEDGTIRIRIDTEPPTHCFLTKTCQYYPIMMKESIVNSIIDVNMTSWIDTSGIKEILLEVFEMRVNLEGTFLNELKFPVENFSLKNKNITNVLIQFGRFGVYSLRQTVIDLAGNFAKARKIVLYTDKSYHVNDSVPIYLDKKNTIYDQKLQISFIRLSRTGLFKFNLNWQERFLDSNLEEWKKPVQKDDNIYLDDTTEDQFGRRSINKLKNYANLLVVSYAYKATNSMEEVKAPEQNEFYLKKPDDPNFLINFHFQNNTLLTIWFELYDIFGKYEKFEPFVFIFEADYITNEIKTSEFKTQTSSQFESSLYLNVMNKISGIKQINYRIVDESNIAISEDIFAPKILHKHILKRSTGNGICDELTDKDCYCVKFFNECYLKTQEIVIDNCKFDKYVDKNLYISYEVLSYSNAVTIGTTKLSGILKESVPCRDYGISKSALIGIICASIIAFLLLILVLVFCIFYFCCKNNRYSKQLRLLLINHKQRNNSYKLGISKDSENPLYTTAEEYHKEMIKINTRSSNVNIAWPFTKSKKYLILNNQLSIGDIIAHGKFANIRKGVYTYNNKSTNVAIKSVIDLATKLDEDMMRQKIIFLKNIEQKDVNLVEFLGASQTNFSNAPSMVLELCDITLKDWLKLQESLTSQTLVDIFRFSLHIAKALDTLHKKNVIHRKVALRNVLLKKESYGYQAKLIGYGPSPDMDPENPNRSSLVALKWLAPETLNSLDETEPTYNTQTDIWSYGITLWEIFSLGAAPYAQHPSAQINIILASGERLERPKECPQTMFDNCILPCWNIDPFTRPSLSNIIKEISNSTRNSNLSGYYSKKKKVPTATLR